MTSKGNNSPVRTQYLDIKSQHPDAILFFRLGDFYETFDEDAENVSKVLDIVLTSRNVGKGQRVPMAGIPHHAAENYLSRLIDRGYHVAICEQVGTEPENGLMPREVVRIVTPGTLVEPGLLPGDANNYLAAVVFGDDTAGVAYVDITTGEFAVTELLGERYAGLARAELNRLRAAEVLIPESLSLGGNGKIGFKTKWPDWRFEGGRCEETLKAHFGVKSLDGFGLRDKPLAIRAAGGILQYLSETQPKAIKLLSGLKYYSIDDFMTLDAATRRNLELVATMKEGAVRGSLLGVLDKSVSPMGRRLMRQWVSQPLLELDLINERQQGVGYFFDDGMKRAEIRQALKPISDLERLTNRVVGGTAIPRDLVAIRETLIQLPSLLNLLPKHEKLSWGKFLVDLSECLQELELLNAALVDEPPATLNKTGVFRGGYSDELDGVLDASKHARDWIAELESKERQRTGVSSLKVGYNKVFGYYIELTKANAEKAPEEYIRKQTLLNAERYITPEMKEYESLVMNAEEQIREIEARLFGQLCERLAESADKILGTARAIARVDVLAALAEVAAVEGFVQPEMSNSLALDIQAGRHPVVEDSLPGGERFVPNATTFEAGERVRIITGPNMSGKSTYLRQTALIVLLAQIGSYVPAESAKIGLVDRIFTRIGAQDEIHAGQSTFMVEMVEVANILHHASEKSLLILDEVGRGTSTYDGVSIAWAVVEHIHNHASMRARTLFATHYHELTQLSELLPGVTNYNVAVSEQGKQVVFLHQIVAGGADRSYGIHVGKLAGLPATVVARAEEILRELEASSGNAVRRDDGSQMAMFSQNNPLLDALGQIDVNVLSPMEALNKLFELQQRFLDEDRKTD